MKRLFLIAFALIAMTLAVVACKKTTTEATSGAAATGVFTAAQQADYSAGDKAAYLAGGHIKLDESMDCSSCHDAAIPDDSESAINATCINCHGDMAAMAAITAVENNPHSSHMGMELNCTVCHSGHVSSFSFCDNCHTFNQQMAYGGPKKPFPALNPADYANAKPSRTEKTDIVVIGAGAAGMTAALTAAEAGKKVVILEKMPVMSGNSSLAAGGMNAAGTDYQKAAGVNDDVKTMFDDTMKGGGFQSNPELVQVLAENSKGSIEWLTERGIILDHINIGGGMTNARFHTPSGGTTVGPFVTNHLEALVAANPNIEVRLNSRVVRINTAGGAATGIIVEGKHTGIYEIQANSVILAAGGFGANAEMVKQYEPKFVGMTTSNQPGAKGEGMLLADAAGAELIDMTLIQIHPSIAAGSQILITEGVRGAGAIMVNHEGLRFVDELTTRDKASAAILAQNGQTAWMIFDEDTRGRLAQINGYFHLNLAKEGKTIEELAAAINVPAAALKASIEKYNGFVEAKQDAEFARVNMAQTIGHGAYYAIEVAPGIHYTMGGVKINTEAEVIGKDGKVMPHFFAAGEVTGGVHGNNRLGGNSVSETITFGRIAGENAAK